MAMLRSKLTSSCHAVDSFRNSRRKRKSLVMIAAFTLRSGIRHQTSTSWRHVLNEKCARALSCLGSNLGSNEKASRCEA